jgi:UDP-glucose 4-epimerase
MNKTILVTGGAGYIGSHTVVDLVNNDYEVVIVDNFCNSNKKVIDVIERLTNRTIKFYESDLKNYSELLRIFNNEKIDAVIHFAGYKAVGESVRNPLTYYENNIVSTINLLKAMETYEMKRLVFSSSATVYGDGATPPILEDSPLKATSPYGRSKIIIEEVLEDKCYSDRDWGVISLRYFNPLGAHPSGEMGEQPNGIPNNLAPYVSQVAVGKLDYVKVFGNDYDTPDGTGIRDYVHVMDLAEGHTKAVNKLFTKLDGYEVFNLGSGKGYSVYDVINCFEKVSGKSIPYKIEERRSGDIGISFASIKKASEILNWTARRNIMEMCEDAWRWQSIHPEGY